MTKENPKVTATFSFVLAAEWDYVSAGDCEAFKANKYDITISDRVNMKEAVKLLIDSGNWEPYATIKTSLNQVGELARNHRTPLYGEYLYFNSHMRELIYNQTEYDQEQKAKYYRELEHNADDVVVLNRKMKRAEYCLWRIKRDDETGAAILCKYVLPISGIELRLYSTGVMLAGIRCHYEDAKQEKKGYKKIEYAAKVERTGWRFEDKFDLDQLSKNEDAAETPCDEADYAWIENCGRRMFSARMLADISIGSVMAFFGDYPLYSEVEIVSPVEQTINCQVCDFRKTLKVINVQRIKDEIEKFDQEQNKDLVDIEKLEKEKIAFEQAKRFSDYKQCVFEIKQLREKTKPENRDKNRNKLSGLLGNQAEENTHSDEDINAAYQDMIDSAEKLSFCKELICKKCISKKEYFESQNRDAHIVIDCFNDDRMYVHGTVVSKEISANTCAGWFDRQHLDGQEQLKEWYGILFADAKWHEPTFHDGAGMVEALERATDSRWAEYGTFHGMTYHSMIMLLSTHEIGYLFDNNNWSYYQMFLIGVLQRCSIQRFYREAAGLLQGQFSRGEKHSRAVQDKYTVFLNHYWFSEVTEQEQGKGMFAKLQEAMNIKNDAEFLERALEEVHQQEQNKMESAVNTLLVPTAILGGIWAFTEMSQYLIKNNIVVPVENGKFIDGWYWLNGIEITVFFVLMLLIVWQFGAYIKNQMLRMKEKCPFGKEKWTDRLKRKKEK